MKLKKNLMIGAHIFAAGTDLVEIPEALRSQIPAWALDGVAVVLPPSPAVMVEATPKPPTPQPSPKRRR